MQKTNTLSRINILAFLLLVIMAVFVARLFWLQVIKRQDYVIAAKSSQQRSFVISADRGEIYMFDRADPVPVVLNQTVYAAVIDPVAADEAERPKLVSSLRDIVGGELVEDFEGRLVDKRSRYEILAKNITRSQAESLKKKQFSGLYFQKSTIRNYPEGGLGAHLLGFVNAEGSGQYGVEGALDDRLKGRDGLLRTVTDVRDIPLTVGSDNLRIEPKPGDNLVLAADRNIQSFAESALKEGIEKAGATEGSVVVMDPNSGGILAMANYPSYSPSEYYKQKDAAVFMNSSTMLSYEPASVIKVFLMAAAIDQGAITASSTFENSDCIQVIDRSMCNALKGLSGRTSMQEVLNNSLNVGTITAARRLGNGSQIDLGVRQTIYKYYHDQFGLGVKTGIELSEADGQIFKPDSVEGNEVRYSAMTFGQGMTASMIQIAAGFCSVVNGGEYFRPTVIAGQVDGRGQFVASQQKPIRRTISSDTSQQVTQMLFEARKSAWFGKEDKPGYLVGGKTGTAESVVDGEYTKKETVATYVGYGGSDRAEYVIIVRVAAPGRGLNLEGGLHAGPIFTKISNQMIDYMKLAPRR